MAIYVLPSHMVDTGQLQARRSPVVSGGCSHVRQLSVPTNCTQHTAWPPKRYHRTNGLIKLKEHYEKIRTWHDRFPFFLSLFLSLIIRSPFSLVGKWPETEGHRPLFAQRPYPSRSWDGSFSGAFNQFSFPFLRLYASLCLWCQAQSQWPPWYIMGGLDHSLGLTPYGDNL